MLRKSTTLALAALAFWVVPAFAQGVDVSPFVGAVVPLSNVDEVTDPTFGTVEAKHKVGVAFGGRVTIWTPSSLGFEGQAAFALSDGEVTVDGQDVTCADLGEPDDCLDASIFFGAAKVMYRFGPPTGVAAFHLGGGVALISRGGTAFEGVDGTTDIGGILNVGASFKVGPVVSIRVDAEDYLSSAEFGADDLDGESSFQNDLVLSAGVNIALGR